MEDKLGWAGWGAGRRRQAMMKAGWEGEDSRGIKAAEALGTKKVKVLGTQLCPTLRSHGL